MLIEKESAQNNINKIKLIEKTCTDRNLKREINKVLNSQLSFFLYIVIESIILLLLLKLSFYFIINSDVSINKTFFVIIIFILLIFMTDFILFLIDFKTPISFIIKKACDWLCKRRSRNKSLEKRIKQRYRISISKKDYDLIKNHYIDNNYQIVNGIDLISVRYGQIIFNEQNFEKTSQYDHNYCAIIDRIQLKLNL